MEGVTHGRADILDLEPRRAAVSLRCIVDLGHVEGDGTLVIDGNVGSKRDGATSSHRNGAGLAAILAANIAAEIVGSEVRHRGVVVRVLPDVLVCCALDTVGGKVFKDICKKAKRQ